MRALFAPLLGVALSTALLGFAAPASAGVRESCGLFQINTNTQCEIRTSGGCVTSCQPLNFTAQCSAELYVGCNGTCKATVEASCTTNCQASCESQCQVDPGKFECAADCRAECGASCDASCMGSASGRCHDSCESTCAGKCDARCEATPPSADCKTKCQSSCSGSCDAEANMDCQISCQADGFVTCETKLQGGCETACSKPEGALFCDGQYVEVKDSFDQCMEDLKAQFQITVKGYAYGEAGCEGGSCSAEGHAGFSCAQAAMTGESSGSALGILGAIAAFGLAVSRRKNQRA